MTVALVLVSHSESLATGLAELAAQMAPDVKIVAAGGADDGALGTSFDRITAALATADSPDGTVVLYDLGSALLSSETALEFAAPEVAGRVTIVDAPLVEGAVAAAVAAQGGADRAAVAAAARRASGGVDTASASSAESTGQVSRSVTVRNRLGLHARPAAELARALGGLAAEVRLTRPDGESADVASVLEVLALAAAGGTELTVSAGGPDAERALTAVTSLIESGFGED